MRVLAAALVLLLAGCSGAGADGDGPERVPPRDDRVRATLDGVDLRLEVADTTSERAYGLMGRTEVPPGTGMVFLYDAPSRGAFYMYDVPIPLRATFIREGRVVFDVVMPPCEQGLAPQDCPTYGPDEPFDAVVETDPTTLPDVRPGDRFELRT